MLFNSYIFVLLFLPLAVCGYFFLNSLKHYKLSAVFLLGMSLWFYAYFNLNYLPLIIASVLMNYVIYTWICKAKCGRKVDFALVSGIIFNLSLLFYYKYYDFFVENINVLFKTDFVLNNLLLPLGISFFTFQQISFLVDSRNGMEERYSFLDYALFVTYFPQLIAGPIVSHDEFIPQFRDLKRKKPDWDNLAKGLFIFAIGLGKKVLVADTFGNAVNWSFSYIDSLTATDAVLTMLAYTIQIYFDFSGYCDMAIGIGKMMNIDLPQNFNSPYKAKTIVEFWSRWHMTLTRFFRKYVYFPLGGSRKSQLRTVVNTMTVFLLSGLWHGANWTFVLWGAMHGVLNVLTKIFKKQIDRVPGLINWLGTFVFVNLAWLFFRAETISDAVHIISKIGTAEYAAPSIGFISAFTLPEFTVLSNVILNKDILSLFPCFYLLAFFAFASFAMFFMPNAKAQMDSFKPGIVKSFAVVFILVWCIFSFSGMSTFLYFNF